VAARSALRVVGAVDDDLVALDAVRAQVVEPLQIAALALPVPDRVLHELERRRATEIVDREDGIEDRLQPDILALGRGHVHLEETMVGLALNFDQVRDGNARMDFRKVHAVPIYVRSADIGH
jgi:hypothetical protein